MNMKIKRVSAGTSDGGQFARQQHAEANVDLDAYDKRVGFVRMISGTIMNAGITDGKYATEGATLIYGTTGQGERPVVGVMLSTQVDEGMCEQCGGDHLFQARSVEGEFQVEPDSGEVVLSVSSEHPRQHPCGKEGRVVSVAVPIAAGDTQEHTAVVVREAVAKMRDKVATVHAGLVPQRVRELREKIKDTRADLNHQGDGDLAVLPRYNFMTTPGVGVDHTGGLVAWCYEPGSFRDGEPLTVFEDGAWQSTSYGAGRVDEDSITVFEKGPQQWVPYGTDKVAGA